MCACDMGTRLYAGPGLLYPYGGVADVATQATERDGASPIDEPLLEPAPRP